MTQKTETKRLTKEVTYQLDDFELVALARKASQVRMAKMSLEAEFIRVKTAYKGRIEEKDTEITNILDAIRDGQEKRVCDVEETFDYITNSIVVVDVNSGRVIDRRAMTVEERQMSLGFKAPAQGSLPLDQPSPVELHEVEAVMLPDPTEASAEVFVTGNHEKATIVTHGAKSWRLEIGEGAMFKPVEEEIFGKPTLVYEKAAALAPADTKASVNDEADEVGNNA